jgi:hypothetical protein
MYHICLNVLGLQKFGSFVVENIKKLVSVYYFVTVASVVNICRVSVLLFIMIKSVSLAIQKFRQKCE